MISSFPRKRIGDNFKDKLLAFLLLPPLAGGERSEGPWDGGGGIPASAAHISALFAPSPALPRFAGEGENRANIIKLEPMRLRGNDGLRYLDCIVLILWRVIGDLDHSQLRVEVLLQYVDIAPGFPLGC